MADSIFDNVLEFAAKQDAALLIPWVGTAEIFAQLPPYPWLVPGLHIAPGRITLLCGYADVGKTVIAMSIALAVASGKAVWGVFKPARQGDVLHLNGEIGSYLARERYQRLARTAGIEWSGLTQGALRLSTYPDVRLDHPDFEKRLTATCRGCALVVIDSLRAFSGALNENAKEIGVALLMLARVSEATGATILVLHHNRKPSENDDPDEAKLAISGSTSILGGSECAFVMSAKKRGPIVVKHERSPLGKYMEDFGLRIEDVEKDGDPRWGLRVVHMESEEMGRASEAARMKREQDDRERAERAIVTTLTKSGGGIRCSRKELRALSGVGETPFGAAMAALISNSTVTRAGSYHEPEWRLTHPHNPHSSAPVSTINVRGADI